MVGASKLTEEHVLRIHEAFKQGMSDQSIADIFGVTRNHINRIRHGHRWNIEKNSFIMKKQLENEERYKNFAIVRIYKDNEVLHAYEISPEKIEMYKQSIESVFENQSGGWSINIRLNVA